MSKVGLDIVRVHARISGRVQGVSFRASTVVEARRAGLVGWVRNRNDGSVELEAEGEAAAVRALLAWCERGPPSARVTGVEPAWISPRADETSFGVRY